MVNTKRLFCKYTIIEVTSCTVCFVEKLIENSIECFIELVYQQFTMTLFHFTLFKYSFVYFLCAVCCELVTHAAYIAIGVLRMLHALL